MLNLIGRQVAALQQKEHEKRAQQQAQCSDDLHLPLLPILPTSGAPVPIQGSPPLQWPPLSARGPSSHPMRWKGTRSASLWCGDFLERELAATEGCVARIPSGTYSQALCTDNNMSSTMNVENVKQGPPFEECPTEAAEAATSLGPPVVKMKSAGFTATSSKSGLESYKSLLRAGQKSEGVSEYDPLGEDRPRSEPLSFRSTRLPMRTLLTRRWASQSEPQSLGLLKEQNEAMELMLRAHKEHENAVLSLMRSLELSREAREKRNQDFARGLVVPPPPPPPLVPMRFGRFPKTRLSSDEEAKAAKRLFRESRGNTELVEKFNIPITGDVLRCLEGSNWLNDEVINFYLNMLQERNAQQLKKGEDVCRCFFFSTFFYAKLSGPGGNESNSYNYEGVRRWTRRQKVDLFEQDLIFIPLHLGQLHWTLGVIDMREGKESIRFYDSLGGRHKPLAWRIRRYLQDEHKDKKGTPLDENRSWYAKPNGEPEDGTPQQENGYDCGVFLCQMAECISDGRAFDFEQSDIKNMRLKMALDIVRGHIDI